MSHIFTQLMLSIIYIIRRQFKTVVLFMMLITFL